MKSKIIYEPSAGGGPRDKETQERMEEARKWAESDNPKSEIEEIEDKMRVLEKEGKEAEYLELDRQRHKLIDELPENKKIIKDKEEIPSKKNYEAMDFNELEADPIAGPILQEKSIKSLKVMDKSFFEEEFTGELDSDGYLIKKDGSNPYTMPSQNISGGLIMKEVIKKTKKELATRENRAKKPDVQIPNSIKHVETRVEDNKNIDSAPEDSLNKPKEEVILEDTKVEQIIPNFIKENQENLAKEAEAKLKGSEEALIVPEFIKKEVTTKEENQEKLDESSDEALIKKGEEMMTPEQKEQSPQRELDYLNYLKQGDKKIEKDAEEKGVLSFIRKVGERYSKIPLKYKLLTSVALISVASGAALVGGAAAGTIATAAIMGSGLQRAMGGIATAVAVEGLLKKVSEKEGKKRSRVQATMHTAVAGALGISIGGGFAGQAAQEYVGMVAETEAGQYIKDLFGQFWTPSAELSNVPVDTVDTAQNIETATNTLGERTEFVTANPPSDAEKIANIKEGLDKMWDNNAETPAPDNYVEATSVASSGTIPTPTPEGSIPEPIDLTAGTNDMLKVPPATSVGGILSTEIPSPPISGESVKFLHTAEKGDNLWNLLKERLSLNGMNEAQQTYAIDDIKDKFAAMSPEKLKELGFSSGDINKIGIGDKLNLTSILGNEEMTTKAVKEAMNLTNAQMSSIEASNASMAEALHNGIQGGEIVNTDAGNLGASGAQAGEIVDTNAGALSAEGQAGEVVNTNSGILDSQLGEKSVDIGDVMREANQGTLPYEVVEAQAEAVMKTDLGEIYKPGFFSSFFSNSQVNQWAEVQAQPAEGILNASTNLDNDAFGKMIGGATEPSNRSQIQDYLKYLNEKSGLYPLAKENTANFIKRALIFITSKE